MDIEAGCTEIVAGSYEYMGERAPLLAVSQVRPGGRQESRETVNVGYRGRIVFWG